MRFPRALLCTASHVLHRGWPLLAAAGALLVVVKPVPNAPAQIFGDNNTDVVVLKEGADLLLREDAQEGDGLRMDLDAITIVENGVDKVRFSAPSDLLPAADSGCDIREPGKVVVCPLPQRIRVEAARLSDRVAMDGSGSDQIAIPTVIDGGSGDDDLTGGAASDALVGGGQEDVLRGGPGDDSLNGGSDDDTLDGGGDQDLLDGGGNADVLDGAAGVDTLTYAARLAPVVVTIGEGANDGNPSDVSDAGSSVRDRVLDSVERIDGTRFRDDLTGDSPHAGDSGDDFLLGKEGNDDLDGAGGADVAVGENGDDTIRGGAGPDSLLGGSGGDLMAGDEGDDKLDGGDGPDGMQGGTGVDLVDYSGVQLPVSVTIGNGLADDGSNSDGGEGARDAVASDVEAVAATDLNPIERLTGRPLPADSIVGNVSDENLVGLKGNDTLEGAAGADSFDAGDGDDRILAREGVADRAVSCGPGVDAAVVDPDDPVAGDCEQVDRAQATAAEIARGRDVAAGAGARAAILSRRARVSRNGTTTIRIRCLGAAARCRGSLRLLASKRVRNRQQGRTLRLRKGQVLARARLSFWVERTAKIELRLSRAGRRMLSAQGKLRVRAVLLATDESLPADQATPTTAVRAVALRAAPKRRKRR